MGTVKKEVVVSKEASELADAVVTLVKSIKTHGKDGFQAGTDIPAVLMENLQGLSVGVAGVDLLDDEAKENLAAFINAWALAGTELAGLFLAKNEAPTT